jgi:hypothetical protein
LTLRSVQRYVSSDLYIFLIVRRDVARTYSRIYFSISYVYHYTRISRIGHIACQLFIDFVLNNVSRTNQLIAYLVAKYTDTSLFP